MHQFKVGEECRLKSDPTQAGIVVAEPSRRGGVTFVSVKLIARTGPAINVPADELEYIVPVICGRDRLLAGEFRTLRYLRSRLTYEKLANPLRDVLYSLRAARTDFLAHQFKPVLKFLESPAHGLLIADEVGLGKTIEAGYILKELRARQRKNFRRALVVCPASLRVKWMEELNRRFGESFELADAAKLRDLAAKIEREGEHVEFSLVTSYQTLRSRSVRSSIETLGVINLTILDEAHHFRNPNTQAHDVAECLREISDNYILLSATPVQLGDENLHALLRLIAPDLIGDYVSFRSQFRANQQVLAAARMIASSEHDAREQVLEILDALIERRDPGVPLTAVRTVRERVAKADLSSRVDQLELRSDIRELSPLSTLMSRTRKREVSVHVPLRKAWQPVVELTPEERLVYDYFTAQSRRGYGAGSDKKKQQVSRFRSVLQQQQIASCLPAFLRTAELQDDGLVTYGDPSSIDDLDDGLTDEEIEFRAEAIRQQEEVTSAIQTILQRGIDSKFDQLLTVFKRLEAENPGGKLVVFSFYKRTLHYLAERLRRIGVEYQLISGDVPSSPENKEKDQRAACVERFHTDPKIRVLLSSEVGSEGLDFQRASNAVVHYDLPWNPMKVEQRIGRVDRHGQPCPVVHTVAFAIPGTIEERIRETLYERIGVFERAIGDLEDILADELHEIEQVVMSPELTEEQRDRQLNSIADALVQQAEERRRLENDAARLMGHDDTFDQELAVLEKSGRSIAAEEIADFIEEALETDRIRAVPVRKQGQRSTQIDDLPRLQDFLRKNLPKGTWGRIPILYEKPASRITLDYADSNADHFITAHHALAHAAIELRRQALSEADEPVVALRISRQSLQHDAELAISPGVYVFVLTRLTDSGSVRDSYSIVAEVVDLAGVRLPVIVAERVVQVAITRGEDHRSLRLPDVTAERVIDALEASVVERRAERERELREKHSQSLQMRLESRRSRVVTALGRIRSRIAQSEFNDRKPNYRNMTLGNQRNLEKELQDIEKAFQNPAMPTVLHQSFGYGLLEVVA